MGELGDYRYRGARALVLLHEHALHGFLAVWRQAKAEAVALPETDDPSYASHEALLRHVLKWAGRYMAWICEKLELPDPGIPPIPVPPNLEEQTDEYVQRLLRAWRAPLGDVAEERFFIPEYQAPWKVNYCVEAMLEHAVMHPTRHRFQLRELLDPPPGG